MALSSSDLTLLIAVFVIGAAYLFYSSSQAKSTPTNLASSSLANGAGAKGDDAEDAGRDPVKAMTLAKKKILIFYGSQTGTAEDYATKIAKEAKARFGLSSLVCDLEEYDYETLDTLPEDALVIFALATYGEGEPTDNAVGFMEFIKGDEIAFSKGGAELNDFKYVIFSLGNSTYEHFCAIGRQVDERLTALGGKRVGERGEGDDDKSMEEDYLSWKDGMWEAVQNELGWQEGAGGDSPDFEVEEVASVEDDKKVYLGELSQRALTGSRGIYDAKNPYAAPLIKTKELFEDGDRNCVFAEFDITDSGIRYQTGDHVGVWPLNPEEEVERFLHLVGLSDKRDQVINVTSLDPALAKVPFPVPTTYATVFRNYLDICAHASRQTVGGLAKFAPTPEAKALLEKLGSDKDFFHHEVGEKCYKLAEVFIMAAGDSLDADPKTATYKTWDIPFDRIISSIPRLQPRYYSISSSPKLHPDSIHVTAVVLKYKANEGANKHVFGVGTNYLLNLKNAAEGNGVIARVQGEPHYTLEGPRGKYRKENGVYAAPIHVRRSTFRLPTSPKIPVIMIGPGTGVAPFRGFIQERVALARKAKEKGGESALDDWGTIDLFYGCRRSTWDYLYRDEWQEYQKELGGKFRLHTAFSREPGQPKVYVQKLIAEQSDHIADALLAKKGYAYICGEGKFMAREVEHLLEDILGKGKGGGHAEGVKELKLLKDRNRLLLDVWS